MGCDSTSQSGEARRRGTRQVRPSSVPPVSLYASTHTPQPHPASPKKAHPHRNAHAQPPLTVSAAGYTGVYRCYGRGRAGPSAEPAHPYRAEFRGRYLGTFPTKLKAAVAYARARQQSAPAQQSRGQQSRTWQRPRQRASTVSPSYSVTGDGAPGAEASAEEEDGDDFIDSIRIRAQEQPPMTTQYGRGEEEEQGEQEEQEEWDQLDGPGHQQQQQYLQQQQQQQQQWQQQQHLQQWQQQQRQQQQQR